MKIKIPSIAFVITVFLFAFLPNARAVSPAPDGGYPGGNTAEGQNALLSLTTGGYNTAVGFFSLRSDATGSFNTAVGAGALLANTGDENTATGIGALLSNTGSFNTANGAFALVFNTTGDSNTAVGFDALYGNTTGFGNTALGPGALSANTTGSENTAIGLQALASNIATENNTAVGAFALGFNTGAENTGLGDYALGANTMGSDNTAIGAGAGANLTTGNNNIDIGSGVQGVAGESNTIRIGDNLDNTAGASKCYVGGILNQTVSPGTAVYIGSAGRLGTVQSSKRFKQDISPMNNASEVIFQFKPVTFRYKKEIDPAGTSQFGLVAEDVERVNPDLIIRDQAGKPQTVRYEQINAMLLNEFLKEHRKVQKLEATVAALAAQLERVSAQVQMDHYAAQLAANHQ